MNSTSIFKIADNLSVPTANKSVNKTDVRQAKAG
jgi:hypothetical protein